LTHLSDLAAAIGAAHVATGPDADRWRHDRTGRYPATPLAAARPGTTAAIGAAHVATGPDADRWPHDGTGRYPATPLAVARPGTTAEVAQLIRLAALSDVPMAPSPTTADFVPKVLAP
jgi:FAD/FMN-containing dehydrogenase